MKYSYELETLIFEAMPVLKNIQRASNFCGLLFYHWYFKSSNCGQFIVLNAFFNILCFN